MSLAPVQTAAKDYFMWEAGGIFTSHFALPCGHATGFPQNELIISQLK